MSIRELMPLTPQQKLSSLAELCTTPKMLLGMKRDTLVCLPAQAARELLNSDITAMVTAFRSLVGSAKIIDFTTVRNICLVAQKLLRLMPQNDPEISEQLMDICKQASSRVTSAILTIPPEIRSMQESSLLEFQSDETRLNNAIEIKNLFLKDPALIKNEMTLANVSQTLEAAHHLDLDDLKNFCEVFCVVQLEKKRSNLTTRDGFESQQFFQENEKEMFQLYRIGYQCGLMKLLKTLDEISEHLFKSFFFFDSFYRSVLEKFKNSRTHLTHFNVDGLDAEKVSMFFDNQPLVGSLSVSASTLASGKVDLARLEYLHTLHIKYGYRGNDSFIPDIDGLQNIQNLTLTGKGDAAHLQLLLGALPDLCCLTFSMYHFSGARILVDLLEKVPRLQSLTVLECFSSIGTELSSALEKVPEIKSFAITRSFLSEKDVADALRNTRLLTKLIIEIDAKWEFFNCDGVGIAHALTQIPDLHTFTLSVCTANGDGMVRVLNALPNTIESLNLSSCQLTSQALHALKRFSGLRELDLSCCGITDETLRDLGHFPQLRTLKLAHCWKITDTGFAYFSQFPELRELDISFCAVPKERECNITGLGLAHLVRCAKLVHLDIRRVTYSVGGTPLRGQCGVVHYKVLENSELAHLALCPSLQSVHISEAYSTTKIFTKVELMNLL